MSMLQEMGALVAVKGERTIVATHNGITRDSRQSNTLYYGINRFRDSLIFLCP